MARKSSSKSSSRSRSSGRSTSRKSTKSSSRSSKSKRTRSSSSKRSLLIQLTRHQWMIILGILLVAVASIALLSLLALSQGTVTDWLWHDLIWPAFGYGGVIIPVLIGLLGLYLMLWGMEQPPAIRWERVGGAGIIFVALEGILHLFYLTQHPEATVEQIASLGTGGGYLGGGLATLLSAATGWWGALILCLALASIGGVMAAGLTFAQVAEGIKKVISSRQRQASIPRATPVRQEPTRAASKPAPPAPPPADVPAKDLETAKADLQPMDSAQPGLFYGDAVAITAAHYQWQLPAVSAILEPGSENAVADTYIREQVEIIEHTLRSFGAPARVVEVNRGPVITQYGVEPLYIEQRNGRRVKVKVGQINSLADDLALALAARSIRIEAPVPGKGYVGIEVPNAEVSLVSLRDVMESEDFAKIKSYLTIGLGQDVSGHAIAADLTQMPHLLIAGATGSGKSVCVNSIITCMLLQNKPDQLRLLMVDPKRVELTNYNGIPHLLMPVIVDLDKVVGALQWVTREMDNRYRRFSEQGARNIAEYNRLAGENGNGKLPLIVVVVDELADLMMMAPDETERTVCRLAQMARATGIHLVIATQRPSVDVVTGLIKANFPARIAFAVASSTDSRVILDTTGAERLLGRGDMLLMSPDASQPLRMQGCFVSDAELRHLVDYWRRQRIAAVQAARLARGADLDQPSEELVDDEPLDVEPEPIEPASMTMQQPLWEDVIKLEEETSQKDELLDDAIALVREMGKASVSLLQRRMRIGYTRAARLIDDMEAMGIVGPHPGGSRQREVLPAPEETESSAD